MTGGRPDDVVLEAIDVTRTYTLGEDVVVHALRGVSLRVTRSDSLAIIGTSGSGKSTLLNLLGALDRPTTGQVLVDGRDVQTLSEDELADLRNRRIGFVFQSFHLLNRQTALENVMLPLLYGRVPRRDRRGRAEEALAAVGLADRMDHKPTELSGGQQQRVAIARALVTRPDLILADEPTGNLDTTTGEEVLALLQRIQAERGTALITITHDPEVAAAAQRRIVLRDGLIVDEEAR